MMTKEQPKPFPSFFSKKHTVAWYVNHLKILNALNSGCRTIHEIWHYTNLSYFTIRKHKKEIIECPNCHYFVNKDVFCFFCKFRLIESYG